MASPSRAREGRVVAKRMHLVAESRGDSKERAKVTKEWDVCHHVVIQRYRGGPPKPFAGLMIERGDSLDAVLDEVQKIVDDDAAEQGPGHYIASFRTEDDRIIGPIALVGGTLPEEGTVESESLKTIKAQAAAVTGMAKALTERETALAASATAQAAAMSTMLTQFTQMMAASATGTAATADATVKIAGLQFMADEARHERADERAKNEADAKNMADALKVGQSIATPLVGIYAEHLKEELAEKREEKKAEKARKKAAEARMRAEAEAAEAEARRPARKKKRAKKKAAEPSTEPKPRAPRPRRERRGPAEAPPDPPKERPPTRAPSSGLVADAAAFLESVEDDGTDAGEWQRLYQIVGQDLWDCLTAVAKAPSDAAARGIMAKAVDIIDGPLIKDGGGAREEAKAMPAAERQRMQAELAGLLGWTRGNALRDLLAKGGVRL